MQRTIVGGEPSGSPRAADSRPLLICFSHLRWGFVWQRPQHLLRRAARDFSVVFFEEPVLEAGAEARLDLSQVDGLTVAVPVFPGPLSDAAATHLQRRLLDGLLASRGEPSVLWYYTPMAMPFSRHLSADTVVYDNMDELSAFKGASATMLVNEDDLFVRADLVFTGGFSLYEAKRSRHPRVHAFPSSVEAEHFAAARERRDPEPADQRDIPGPRLGYFGVIDERLDLSLLDGMAALRPDWQFVMIGPVVKISPTTLPRRPNIHWLGQKAYADLPSYLARWDVGLMPFALNEATRFISPTKTPEFLAAGVPVVSTPIADVVRPYGEKRLVQVAQTAEGFVTAAETAMGAPRRPWLARVDRQLARGSWDTTWTAMRRLFAPDPVRPGADGRTPRPVVTSLVSAE